MTITAAELAQMEAQAEEFSLLHQLRLIREVEELRAALREIAAHCDAEGDIVGDIARAALGEG